jgi:hypothetical protein
VLLTVSAMAREPIAPAEAGSTAGRAMELTMMPVVRYADDTYEFPYSCYRLGRCSAYDLYQFRDRPNRLTRLAPAAPAQSDEQLSPIDYAWFFVQVTPEENILPKYRAASQVRDEHRAVSRPFAEAD